jgi:hypothetical protein
MSPLLTRILTLAERLRGTGESDRATGETLRRLIHSPLLDLAVLATPNKADDAILATLRELFPRP